MENCAQTCISCALQNHKMYDFLTTKLKHTTEETVQVANINAGRCARFERYTFLQVCLSPTAQRQLFGKHTIFFIEI